jgi:hypothetical protein
MEVKEKYAPRKFFVTIGGFSGPTFSQFCKKHNICNGMDEEDQAFGVPIFKVMNCLVAERTVRNNYMGKGTAQESPNVDSEELEAQYKFERIQKERINNQIKLGNLISRDRAKERVRSLCLAVSNMIRYGIKNAAPRVAACNDVRDCENILIDSYTNALDELKRKSKNITWEEDGVNNKLGRTTVADDTGEDSGLGGSEEDSPTTEVEYSEQD